jgi:glutamine amidotransferase
MIAVVDYGLGNVKAFINVFKRLNIEARSVRVSDDFNNIDKIILPGVGSFDFAMHRLEASGMHEALDFYVKNKNVPVLGVCVGMQMLGLSSEEGVSPGLGWIDGTVRKLTADNHSSGALLPHMGWNDVKSVRNDSLFNQLNGSSRFYFLHSYYFDCKNEKDIIASTNYGLEFACAVKHENIYGVQFHPEKSHHWGIQLLTNFAEL